MSLEGNVVPPPEGVIMHNRQGNLDFGLESMLHRSVDLNPGSGKSNSVEGTTLVYEPGFIRVDVNKRGISADHINRIGALAVGVHNNLTLQQYLREISRLTDRGIDGIRFLAGCTDGMGLHTPMEEINAKAEGILQGGTGLSKSVLEERQRALVERLLQIDEEAYRMGVIIFERYLIWNHFVRPHVKPEPSEER